MTDLTEPDRAAPGGLIVESTHADGRVLVELRGEIDVASAAEAERELAEAQALAPREIVVDLQHLTFMDSTGVRILIQALLHASDHGYELRLRRVPNQPRRVLEMSGTLSRFKISD